MSLLNTKPNTRKIYELLVKFGFTNAEIKEFNKDSSYPITENMDKSDFKVLLNHILWYHKYEKFWTKYNKFPCKTYKDKGIDVSYETFCEAIFPTANNMDDMYYKFRKNLPNVSISIIAGFPICFFQEVDDSLFQEFRKGQSHIARSYREICSRIPEELKSFDEYMKFCDVIFTKFPEISRQCFFMRSIDFARKLLGVHHIADKVPYQINAHEVESPLPGEVNSGSNHKINRTYQIFEDLKFAKVHNRQKYAGVVAFMTHDAYAKLMMNQWNKYPSLNYADIKKGNSYYITFSPLMFGFLLTRYIRHANRERSKGINHKNDAPLWDLNLFRANLIEDYASVINEKINKIPAATIADIVKINCHMSRIIDPMDQINWMKKQFSAYSIITSRQLYEIIDN